MKTRIEFDRSGIRCPYCHDEVAVDQDWKACAECLARHHAPCWSESGRCGTCGGVDALARTSNLSRRVSETVRAQGASVVAASVLGVALGVGVGASVLRAPAAAPASDAPDPLAVTAGSPAIAEAPVTTYAIAHRPTPKPRPAPAAKPEAAGGAPVAEDAPPPREEPIRVRGLSIDFEPAHFTATPDGAFLLLANREADKVIVWDWFHDEEQKRISVPGGPCYIFVRDKRAYVCNGKLSTLSEIDLDALKVVNTIHLPVGQPYYVSSSSEKNAPIFVTCGDYTNRKVVRVDPVKERVQVVVNEVYMSVLTVHASGRVAVKQGEFGHSPSGAPTVYEMAPGGVLGKQLGYQHESFGLLAPDRKGKYWLGGGGVWDASLAKQVAKLDVAQVLVEHPTDPVLIGLSFGDLYGREGLPTVAFYGTARFATHFTRTFALPRPRSADPYRRNVDLSRPVVVASGASGTTLVFQHRGNVVRLTIAPELYSSAGTRLAKRLPATIPAGGLWKFKLELVAPRTAPTFKALELPAGCELDASSGELAWSYPTAGEYDLAIKVTLGPEESFLVEEHITVENPRDRSK